MAPSPDSGEWQARYTLIEKAYCQGRWETVLEAGTLLLRELPEADRRPELMALGPRVRLLMAHTFLHGYGDRDAAEDLYELVRQSDCESALRQIAAEGLDQCHQPLASTLTVDEDEMGEGSTASPPWLFLPETERTEFAKAPDTPAPVLKPLQMRPPQDPKPPEMAVAPATTPGQPGMGMGMATDPFAAFATAASPASGGGGPVMPWQERTPPSPAPQAPSVVAEVVEEPELIEVHQANPSLAEEVDLEVAPTPNTPIAQAAAQEGAKAKDGGELRAGLLTVVVG